MICLIRYSIVLAYLVGSVFLTHVNGAVCKAKSVSPGWPKVTYLNRRHRTTLFLWLRRAVPVVRL
jgi:hypothetical protein